MRKERQLVGIERKRLQSKKYNRYDFITDNQKNKVVELKQKGLTYRKIKDEVEKTLNPWEKEAVWKDVADQTKFVSRELRATGLRFQTTIRINTDGCN